MAYFDFMIERLNFVENSFRDICASHPCAIFACALNRLEKLSGEAMTPEDLRFISSMHGLLERRHNFLNKVPAAHLGALVAGISLFWLFRLFSRMSGEFWFTVIIWLICLLLWGIFYFVFSGLRPDGTASMKRWGGFASFVFIGCYEIMDNFWDFLLAHNIIWGCFGITASYGVSRYIMLKYLREITDECEMYAG